MFTNILIAYDGSEQSLKAFHYALDIAQRYQATLTLIAVARPSEPASDAETEALLEYTSEHFRQDFAKLHHQAETSGIKLNCKIRVGHPAEQILYQADELPCDLIVMGQRGLGLLGRWRLGSVSKHVSAFSSCPVLITH